MLEPDAFVPECDDQDLRCQGDNVVEICNGDSWVMAFECDPGDVCVDGGCQGCEPQCGDRDCGEDGCGGDCGDCDGECVEGHCPAGCPEGCGELWSATCQDNFGINLCVPADADPQCSEPSAYIPCGEGRACLDGVCSGPCVRSEVVVLLDRSASMAGERWAFSRGVLAGLAADLAGNAQLGVRPFPAAGGGCEAGDLVGPQDDAVLAFLSVADPAGDDETPILAALAGLEDDFGQPSEGQVVVLVTDGGETCADDEAVVERVSALRRFGVRTFAVGISDDADGELLARVAEAGGTEDVGVLNADDADEVAAALTAIAGVLETCICQPDEQICAGDQLLTCAGSTYDHLAECDHGCDPERLECNAVCRPGVDVRCDGADLEVCGAAGDGYEFSETCALGCEPGVGCNEVCREGGLGCDGDALVACEDGEVGEVEVCDHGCHPAHGRCVRYGDVRLDGDDGRSGAVQIFLGEPGWSYIESRRGRGLEAGALCRQLGLGIVEAWELDEAREDGDVMVVGDIDCMEGTTGSTNAPACPRSTTRPCAGWSAAARPSRAAATRTRAWGSCRAAGCCARIARPVATRSWRVASRCARATRGAA